MKIFFLNHSSVSLLMQVYQKDKEFKNKAKNDLSLANASMKTI